MPNEEQTGWIPGLHELEREFDVVAYIVSKCYVIREKKEYFSDGTSKIEYEVVFPFAKRTDTQYDEFVPTVPEYNLYSKCTNSVYVNRLFDSFDEAPGIADKAAKEIIGRIVLGLPDEQDYQIKLLALKERMDRYRKIEEDMESKTCGMLVGDSRCIDLERLIDEIIKKPSEFYIKLASRLAPEMREYLKKLIENRSCANCTNASCRVEHYEKVGLDGTGKPQGSSCVSWNNDELIGRQLIIQKNDH